MTALAIIPAREHSKGIPRKNFTKLAGASPVRRAVDCANRVDDIATAVLSTDATIDRYLLFDLCTSRGIVLTARRPPELAQDNTPMSAVVEHVLDGTYPEEDQIVVLLQPTQPLREPKHIEAAIALLKQHVSGSVVSVTKVETVDKLLTIWRGQLEGVSGDPIERRQAGRATYKRDGTVYAWYRRDGYLPKPWWPLIIPASETCSLDTMEDWHEAERRLREREDS